MFNLTGDLFQTISCPERNKNIVARRSYGVIEVRNAELYAIHFRPYPKLISVAEIKWSEFWQRSTATIQCDRVLLYFNQPMLHRKFLALKYFVSDYKSSLASIAVCLSVLDYVAKVKQTDAIVTEITNNRIKDRHLSHFGWEEHMQGKRGRHWIKRFYGEYPESFLFQDLRRSAENPAKIAEPQMPAPLNPVVMDGLSGSNSYATTQDASTH